MVTTALTYCCLLNRSIAKCVYSVKAENFYEFPSQYVHYKISEAGQYA